MSTISSMDDIHRSAREARAVVEGQAAEVGALHHEDGDLMKQAGTSECSSP